MRVPKSSTLRPFSRRIGSALLIFLLLAGCTGEPSSNNTPAGSATNSGQTSNNQASKKTANSASQAVDTQPSSVYYEVFVRSFYDSDGDGIGDFKGLTEKLDYLNDGNPNTNDDLGIEGIWLMPINPSPSYHGYDVKDYRSINPDYGTMEDFQKFLDEAHKRGIKVIMDLVVNHTAKSNPWFVESAKNKDSKYRNWYIWAEDQKRGTGGTSAAGSGSPWHYVLGSHFLGIFWDGMPDLNFNNQEVRDEMKDVGRFWLKQGVDGFRLDAAKHIYEDLMTDKGKETTEKNVAWWQEFRSGLNEVNKDAYLVGEIWDPSAALIAPYLNKALDSGFNFSAAETIIQSVKSEKDGNLGFTLERIYKLYGEKSGGHFVDATFLTNHDQNRVMSQLEGNVNHAKMGASLLLTLPGNPFIYYGEEIGMLGVKPDEHIREPMQWQPGGGQGQTTWELATNNPGKPGSTVKEQTADPKSLLSHYRNMIRLRNSIPALKEGAIREFTTGLPGITAFVRYTEKQSVLVVHNLTGSSQTVPLSSESNPNDSFSKILKSTDASAALSGDKLTIPAYTTVILE